ncbi:MAG: NADH-quinone oxidoreductase subunit L [Candidatus Omnitrophica bacterium]|nr:NADH-quinone oxidoreductase subunit L [Candidatus Omnitrophota bacterium]
MVAHPETAAAIHPPAWSVWGILFLPLAAFLAISLVTRRSRGASAGLAIGSMGLAFLSTVNLLVCQIRSGGHAALELSVPWIQISGLNIEFGLFVNPLAILMCLVVTGVGLMIFIYSVGYMADDPAFSRYFAFLSLFAFSMLGIVLANNFVTLFIFWELVGASSYLLIGFWYEKPSAADAGKKAFLVNRIADFGFLVGILMLWSLSGINLLPKTLNFIELEARIPVMAGQLGTSLASPLSMVALLLFCGVLGKSAQFPLHVWLPDAMEGPTPVSALIHAATMVAAGVYMLCRTFFLFAAVPDALQVIAAVGSFTALFAASMALVENDIKRILAYSTLSQLGYLVMAVGLGGYTAGMYHLTTHAFFKALLFMGAGCVIHALHTNNIWHMGGLREAMPVTTMLFIVGSLALCGIWPLSGFWSKDEILALAFERNKLLYVTGTLTAGMTSYYMGRLLCAAFLGPSRDPRHHPHEVPPVMYLPLVILAALSAVGGFIGIPALLHHAQAAHVEFNMPVALISSAVAVAGLALAWRLYGDGSTDEILLQKYKAVARVLSNKYYMDDIYRWINNRIQQRTAIILGWVERSVLIGFIINGVAGSTGFCGWVLTRLQTGKVQIYALSIAAGLAAIILAGWRCLL